VVREEGELGFRGINLGGGLLNFASHLLQKSGVSLHLAVNSVKLSTAIA
jgi:hypothetical protein